MPRVTGNDVCPLPDRWGPPSFRLKPSPREPFEKEDLLPPQFPGIDSNAYGEPKASRYPVLQPVSFADDSARVDFKNRIDFAAADSGARVAAFAPNLKGVKSIQQSSDGTYMISECSIPIWVVISLPEIISLEYVAFEISESYSSYYKKIAILATNEYPTEQWKLLSVVDLDHDRVSNVFDLRQACQDFKQSTCWVTHLKFLVLTTGSSSQSTGVSVLTQKHQDICTLTRFRVFGSTLMQGLENKVKGNRTATDEYTEYTATQTLAPQSRPVMGRDLIAAPHPQLPWSSIWDVDRLSQDLQRLLAAQESQQRAGGAQTEDVPPILALVDQLNALEKALTHNTNYTLQIARAGAALKAGVGQVESEIGDVSLTVDKMGADIADVEEQLYDQIRATSPFRAEEFGRIALGDACRRAMRGYALLESVDQMTRRRRICVLASIYHEFDDPHSIQNAIQSTQAGYSISDWHFGRVLNLYIYSLKQKLYSSKTYKPCTSRRCYGCRPDLFASDPAYQAASLYLAQIGRFDWPETFFHLVRIPKASLFNLATSAHPVVLYVAISVAEFIYVFGTFLFSVAASLVYLLVVVNSYFQVAEARHEANEELQRPTYYHKFISTFALRKRRSWHRGNSDGDLPSPTTEPHIGLGDDEDSITTL